MITTRHSVLLLGLLLVSCANPGQTYAGKHPELPAAHRQILTSGKIDAGTAVAGMTHDQVKLAMGGAPAVFDKINGEEAWTYIRKKSVSTDLIEPRQSGAGASGSSLDNHEAFSASDSLGPSMDINVKTTIFFQGDRATHAEVTQEKK